jgi:hypothetical protein
MGSSLPGIRYSQQQEEVAGDRARSTDASGRLTLWFTVQFIGIVGRTRSAKRSDRNGQIEAR